jgi:hypothetical protein
VLWSACSIASSAAVNPSEVAICVGRLSYTITTSSNIRNSNSTSSNNTSNTCNIAANNNTFNDKPITASEQRLGFCSSFLTDHAVPGTKLRFKLVAQPGFRLPFNLAVPVVMVAAGTGIAPFRVSWFDHVLFFTITNIVCCTFFSRQPKQILGECVEFQDQHHEKLRRKPVQICCAWQVMTVIIAARAPCSTLSCSTVADTNISCC